MRQQRSKIRLLKLRPIAVQKKKEPGNSNVGLSMGTGQEIWKPNRENEHILLVGGDWGRTGWNKGLTDSRATEGLEVWLGMEDSSF